MTLLTLYSFVLFTGVGVERLDFDFDFDVGFDVDFEFPENFRLHFDMNMTSVCRSEVLLRPLALRRR